MLGFLYQVTTDLWSLFFVPHQALPLALAAVDPQEQVVADLVSPLELVQSVWPIHNEDVCMAVCWRHPDSVLCQSPYHVTLQIQQ